MREKMFSAKTDERSAVTYPCYFQEFDGVNEFADYLRNTPMNEATKKDWQRMMHIATLRTATRYKDQAKRGVPNFETAVKNLTDGVNVKEIRTARVCSVTVEKRVISRGVYGGAPIVPAYLSGCPQNMLTLKNRPARRSVRVFVDCAYPWAYSASRVKRAGEAIVRVLAKLDSAANYDLVAGAITIDSHGTREINGFCVTIKTAGKPFSASRVSFCLTSPAFLRVLNIVWGGSNPHVPVMEGSGMSLSLCDPTLYKNVMSVLHKDTIVIPLEKVIEAESYGGGERYVTNIFKKSGIALE